MKNSIEITSKAGKTFILNTVANNDHLVEIHGAQFYISQGMLKSQGQVKTFCAAMGFPLDTPSINIGLTDESIRAIRAWNNPNPQKVSLVSFNNFVDVHEHGESIVSQETWLMTDGTTRIFEKRINF